MKQGLELERYHKHQMQLKLQKARDEKLESLRERKELLSLEKSLDNEFAHQQIDKRKSLEEMVRQQTETEEAKRLLQLFADWSHATDTSEKAAIWEEMLEIHAENIFAIGLISRAPQPIAANSGKSRNRLG